MKNTFFYLLIGIAILSSCAPVYVPNTLNTPMMSEKGDLNAAVYAGTSGFDFQASYAATDHLGVMINGSFVEGAKSNDNTHDHKFIEAGAGYYHAFGDRNTFDVFGGFGTGDSYNKISQGAGFEVDNSSNFRFFIQPSIGVKSDILDGSAAVRLVYTHIETNGVVETAFFYEPALTARLGYKNIKGVVQVGYSSPISNGDISFDYQPFLISLGLSARLNVLK